MRRLRRSSRSPLLLPIITCPGLHQGVWIGNCVGYSNTHLFIAFLLVNICVLGYSSYLHYLIFSTKVAHIQRLQREAIAALGAMLHSVRLRTTTQLYWSVILEAEFGGAIFLISVMICVVTIAFLLHHIWLLSTGTTTNESFKWADIKDALACGQIVILDQDDPFMSFPIRLISHPRRSRVLMIG